LGFTLIVPGLAQLVGGNRKLARFGLRATLTIWGLVAFLFVLGLINKGWAIWLVTLPFVGTVISWMLIAYAVIFLVLAFDALRLARLGRLFQRDKWIALGSFVLVASLGTYGISAAGNFVGAGTGAIGSIFNQHWQQR
jgi:hypothetical protein